jgi:hypothetical protein
MSIGCKKTLLHQHAETDQDAYQNMQISPLCNYIFVQVAKRKLQRSAKLFLSQLPKNASQTLLQKSADDFCICYNRMQKPNRLTVRSCGKDDYRNMQDHWLDYQANSI